MSNKFESRNIAVPTEIVKALSIAGKDTLVVRFQDDRTVYCYLDDGEVVVAEDVFESDDDMAEENESEYDDEEFPKKEHEVDDACSECPHFCPVCGTCTKENYLR